MIVDVVRNGNNRHMTSPAIKCGAAMGFFTLLLFLMRLMIIFMQEDENDTKITNNVAIAF